MACVHNLVKDDRGSATPSLPTPFLEQLSLLPEQQRANDLAWLMPNHQPALHLIVPRPPEVQPPPDILEPTVLHDLPRGSEGSNRENKEVKQVSTRGMGTHLVLSPINSAIYPLAIML